MRNAFIDGDCFDEPADTEDESLMLLGWDGRLEDCEDFEENDVEDEDDEEEDEDEEVVTGDDSSNLILPLKASDTWCFAFSRGVDLASTE